MSVERLRHLAPCHREEEGLDPLGSTGAPWGTHGLALGLHGLPQGCHMGTPWEHIGPHGTTEGQEGPMGPQGATWSFGDQIIHNRFVTVGAACKTPGQDILTSHGNVRAP